MDQLQVEIQKEQEKEVALKEKLDEAKNDETLKQKVRALLVRWILKECFHEK